MKLSQDLPYDIKYTSKECKWGRVGCCEKYLNDQVLDPPPSSQIPGSAYVRSTSQAQII